MVCRECNMSRIAAEPMSLEGLSVLRNTTLDVQDKRWAARYNTGLLIKLTPKGVVFSFLILPLLARQADCRMLHNATKLL